jgi:hypothetical protein
VHITVGNATPPANDDFANSFDLAQITTGNNVDATRETGEPPSFWGNGHSVWWHWTAPSNGSVIISTLGSSFRTVIVVYTGTAIDNLTEVASSIAPNPPMYISVTAGTIYQIVVDGFQPDGFNSRGDIQLNVIYNVRPTVAITSPAQHTVFLAPADVPVHVTAQDPDGSVVQIELSLVALANGTTTIFTSNTSDLDYTFPSLAVGDYVLIAAATDNLGVMIPTSVDFTVVDARPANDDFANSFDLAQITTGNNFNATLESGEPDSTARARWGAYHSVWWHWTAPNDASAVISTSGSSFPTIIVVYKGDTIDTLTLVASSGSGDLFYPFTAGTTYHISVDGLGGASGDIQLHVQYDVPPTVAITSPAEGAFFTAPADVPVHVTAQDSDGAVVQIELLLAPVNQRVIFTSPATDLDYTFPSLAAGNYTLFAIATDNLGVTSLPVVTFTVGN